MFSQTDDAMPFLKMHGLGNDFVIFDQRHRSVPLTKEVVRWIGDRNRGVGFDQLVEIERSDQVTAALTFWNSDGSQAQACGNATRCVAELLLTETGQEVVTLQTVRGVLTAQRTPQGPTVNMGAPQLLWSEIPLNAPVDPLHLPLSQDPAAVGMGNPHCVFFVPDVAAVDLEAEGPAIETHPMFPEATNVEFAQIFDRQTIRLRVWERGTGVTQACGSGACATLVAAHRRGLTDARAEVRLDGGSLFIDWRDDGVWMAGPTARVFSGLIDPAALAGGSDGR